LLDADKNVIPSNLAISVTDGMFYRVVAEDSTIVDYPIETFVQQFAKYSAIKVMADNPIVIDAEFDDWADFDNDIVCNYYNGDYVPSSPEDYSLTVKMAWDDTNLYIYWRVLDDVIHTTEAKFWNNDGLEIALVMTEGGREAYNMFSSPETQLSSMKFTYVPQTSNLNSLFETTGLNTKAAIRNPAGAAFEDFTLTDGEDGFEAEFKLPWVTLDGIGNVSDLFDPSEGSEFSFAVAGNENDNDGVGRNMIMLVSTNTNQDATDFPYMVLDPEKPARVVPEDPGTGESVNQTGYQSLSIYPNPVSDDIHITGMDNVDKLIITNITGQVVKRFDNVETSNFSLNVSDLTQGIYFINARTADGTSSTAKFLKK